MRIVAAAPGRVNLIGEHTDYNDGYALPAATPWRVRLEVEASKESSRLVSVLGETQFRAARVEPGEIEGWGAYPAGVAWALRREGYDPPDLIGRVRSDLPIGVGVSSSAALCVAFAAAWNALAGFGLTRLEIARLAQKAESDFVMVRCGLLDQLASAFGVRDHALLIDMRHISVRPIPWPHELRTVLCDTGARRELAASAYNARRAECERASRLLGVATLRDATEEDVVSADFGGDEVARRRARYVASENRRVLDFVAALAAREFDEVGRLALESHASLREDFEVSSPALDRMVDLVTSCPGCVGARMTGAGFGGVCVAFVREGNLTTFLDCAYRFCGAFERNVSSFSVFEPCAGFKVMYT